MGGRVQAEGVLDFPFKKSVLPTPACLYQRGMSGTTDLAKWSRVRGERSGCEVNGGIWGAVWCLTTSGQLLASGRRSWLLDSAAPASERSCPPPCKQLTL